MSRRALRWKVAIFCLVFVVNLLFIGGMNSSISFNFFILSQSLFGTVCCDWRKGKGGRTHLLCARCIATSPL